MELTPTAIAVIGLLLAAWTAAAGWAWLRARATGRRADGVAKRAKRLSRMLDEAPAVPLLVRVDGRVEAPPRLAQWLGLAKVPEFLSEFEGEDGGLEARDLSRLNDAVRATQKTGAPFQIALTPAGSRRSLAMRGALADPQVSPGGAALVWVFDFSDSHNELADLREEAAQAKSDFAALVGLIESAPIPMWFRRNDGRLRLVNSAYVDAVGAADAASVVEDQIELIEASEGRTAAEVARLARESDAPSERVVSATVHGQRRSMQVSDLPVGRDGVAGYAIDIEEMEEQARAFRAFREAQRSMLDQLSIGVAQFNAKHEMVFANQPFQRVLAITPDFIADAPHFSRVLDRAREQGKVPEMRDYPAWRREIEQWFAADKTIEDHWALPGAMHLRVVAQPMPDGGLVMIAEDRTEQLAMSAARDQLLRTRTATFDSLFEALAAFQPNGQLQLWNKRFADLWELEEEFLIGHPKADAIIAAIADKLARPAFATRLGDAVKAAALDRRSKTGRIDLADGRILEFAGVPLPDGNGLLTLLDVTDSQKAEAALRDRAEALEEADKVKTRFLANMSYEFRTPLTSIGGFAELLQAGAAGEMSAQGQEYVAAILTSVERLGEQIETVLDLSQSEAGLLPLDRKPIEMLPFITGLVREREQAIIDADLSLDLKGDRSAGKVEGDARRLGRAFGHLLDNAISATPKGGRILVMVRRENRQSRVVISDNGRGMDGKELARALEGVRLGKDGKQVDRRQGLGLPLARQLVEAHGGKLEVQSERGAGTTVVITLP